MQRAHTRVLAIPRAYAQNLLFLQDPELCLTVFPTHAGNGVQIFGVDWSDCVSVCTHTTLLLLAVLFCRLCNRLRKATLWQRAFAAAVP